MTCRAPGCQADVHARYRFCRDCWPLVHDDVRRPLQEALQALRRSHHEPQRTQHAWRVETLTRMAVKAWTP